MDRVGYLRIVDGLWSRLASDVVRSSELDALFSGQRSIGFRFCGSRARAHAFRESAAACALALAVKTPAVAHPVSPTQSSRVVKLLVCGQRERSGVRRDTSRTAGGRRARADSDPISQTHPHSGRVAVTVISVSTLRL